MVVNLGIAQPGNRGVHLNLTTVTPIVSEAKIGAGDEKANNSKKSSQKIKMAQPAQILAD